MVNRWDRYRARRPNRSRLAETVITTALVSLVVVAFGAALIAVVNNT
ncbi:hypothetical protein AB0E78_03090 [Streptomyces sp. NPDC032198]